MVDGDPLGRTTRLKPVVDRLKEGGCPEAGGITRIRDGAK